jgi:two-component system sensor histidine kinase DegS
LHDNALQSLADLTLRLEACRGLVPTQTTRIRAELRDITRTLRGTIKEIREACLDQPPALLTQGLFHALQWYVAEFSRRNGIAARLQWSADGSPMEPEIESAVFRIVQEALNNVRKHARARKAEVRVEADRRTLRLIIEDDGVGFDSRMLSETGSGFGLRSVRERAQLLRGQAEIASAPHRGTVLTVCVPIEQPRDEGCQVRGDA